MTQGGAVFSGGSQRTFRFLRLTAELLVVVGRTSPLKTALATSHANPFPLEEYCSGGVAVYWGLAWGTVKAFRSQYRQFRVVPRIGPSVLLDEEPAA